MVTMANSCVYRPKPPRFGAKVHNAIPSSITGPSISHAFRLTFCRVHGGPSREGVPIDVGVCTFGAGLAFPSAGVAPGNLGTAGAATGSPVGGLGDVGELVSEDDSVRWSTIGNLTIPNAGNNKAKALVAQIRINPVNFIIARHLRKKNSTSNLDSKLRDTVRDQ
jgi:hypothetical protein